MSVYTKIGTGIWYWEPFAQLTEGAKLLWLVLFTSPESKRSVPGLWHGGIATMADAARMSSDDVLRHLDKLIEHELVEYDQRMRMLRFCMLPDAGESPTNGNTIRGWWRKFQSMPDCAVRNAHVPTLRWLMDQWAKENGKPCSSNHEDAWAETFGNAALVQVPPPTKRRGQRLADHDTSTAVQPSLFSNPEPSSASSERFASENERDSVDNSDSVHQSNNSAYSETLRGRVPSGVGSGSGKGSGSGFFSSPEEGGSGGGGDAGGKPRLVLVPMPAEPPTTAVRELREKLVACLRRGLSMPRAFECTPGDERALDALLVRLASDGIGDGDLPVFEQWLACGGMRLTRQSAHEWTQIAWWVADMNLKRSILTARDWKADAERAQQELAQAMKDAGI